MTDQPRCDLCENDAIDATNHTQLAEAIRNRQIKIVCYLCAASLYDDGYIRYLKKLERIQ